MNIYTLATACLRPFVSIWDLKILTNLQYLAKVNRCSAQNLLESLQIPLPKGVKSLIMRRLKSHYDDADNLNMMGTIM